MNTHTTTGLGFRKDSDTGEEEVFHPLHTHVVMPTQTGATASTEHEPGVYHSHAYEALHRKTADAAFHYHYVLSPEEAVDG